MWVKNEERQHEECVEQMALQVWQLFPNIHIPYICEYTYTIHNLCDDC